MVNFYAMAIKDLQDEILIKKRDGSFSLIKDGQLVSPPSDELIVPQDDLLVVQEEQQNGKPTASFYFDVSDENELRQFKQHNQEKRQQMIKRYIDYKSEEIIRQAGLFKLAQKNRQIKSIVSSYLRGVRNLALAREALGKIKIEQAALDIADDWREVLLNIMQKEKHIVEEVLKSGKIPFIRKEGTKHGQAPASRTEPQKDWGVTYKKEFQAVHGNELPRAIVMGPVEELKAISLADFRKLADSPQEAAEKILEKISYLEDESLIKRAAGIKAWKESEVYKLYLTIGNLSLTQKKPVEQVILELSKAGRPYLTPVEFQAIADLNNRLSY